MHIFEPKTPLTPLWSPFLNQLAIFTHLWICFGGQIASAIGLQLAMFLIANPRARTEFPGRSTSRTHNLLPAAILVRGSSALGRYLKISFGRGHMDYLGISTASESGVYVDVIILFLLGPA